MLQPGWSAGSFRTCWTACARKRGRAEREASRPALWAGTGGGVRVVGLCRCRAALVAEVEVGEVGLAAVGGEVDGGLEWLVEHERVAVKRGEAGESIGRRNSQTAARSGLSPPGQRVGELAGHAFGAERFGAGDAVGVEYERGGPAGGELRDAAERVRVVERALEFGVEDRVGLAGFVAAGVADRLLAFVVGPAGAVGDHVAVVAGEEVADDRFERVQLAGGGVHEPGAEVVAEAEVAVGRLGLAQALCVAAFAVFLVAAARSSSSSRRGAGEERLFAGGLVVVVLGELLVDEVDA